MSETEMIQGFICPLDIEWTEEQKEEYSYLERDKELIGKPRYYYDESGVPCVIIVDDMEHEFCGDGNMTVAMPEMQAAADRMKEFHQTGIDCAKVRAFFHSWYNGVDMGTLL